MTSDPVSPTCDLRRPVADQGTKVPIWVPYHKPESLGWAQKIVLQLFQDVYRLTLTEETSTCEQVIFFLKTSYLNTGRGSHMNPQTGFIHSKCTSWVATTQSDRLSKPVVHPRHSTGDWAWHRSRLQSQRACCPVGEVMPGLKREADQNRHKRTNNQMQTVDSDLDKPSKVISGIIKEIWIQANETKELLSILVHEIMAMQLWKRTLLLK